MAITSGLVLYAVIWFLSMLVMLPIGLRTQGDDGEIVPGTHAGAPNNYHAKRKALQVTGVATVIWIIAVLLIFYSGLSWRDMDWTQNLPPIE